jgi:predicted phage tail protein
VTLDAPATPAAPTNLVATVISRSQINLSWTDNATNEDGFRIERCKGATCTNFTQIATVGPNVTTYANTGLTANTSYRYRVRAYNASGVSAYSNIVARKTLKR